GETAPEPCLEAILLEVDVVVHDEERLGRKLVEAQRRPDRAPGVVHVRLRLEQAEPEAVRAHLCQGARELRAERSVATAGELVDREPADVVPRACIFAARVAEACDVQLERRGGIPPAPEPHGLLLGGFFGRRRLGFGLAALGGSALALLDALLALLALLHLG